MDRLNPFERFVERHMDQKWNWNSLNLHDWMTINFFKKYPSKINFKLLSESPIVTEEFVRDNIDENWSWGSLGYNKNISYDFIDQHITKSWRWTYSRIKEMHGIWDRRDSPPLWFIKKYGRENNINWKNVCKYANSEVIEYCAKHGEGDFESMSTNINLTPRIVAKYIDKPWSFTLLSGNPNFVDINFVNEFREKGWAFGKDGFSFNEGMTLEFFEAFRHESWSFSSLSYLSFINEAFVRKYITSDWKPSALILEHAVSLEFIENNDQIEWDWRYISFYRKDLTLAFLKRNMSKIDWRALSNNQHLTFDIVDEFMESGHLNLRLINTNPSCVPEIYYLYPYEDWKFDEDGFAVNPSITTEFLLDNIDKFSFSALTLNPALNFDMIEKTIDMPWEWGTQRYYNSTLGEHGLSVNRFRTQRERYEKMDKLIRVPHMLKSYSRRFKERYYDPDGGVGFQRAFTNFRKHARDSADDDGNKRLKTGVRFNDDLKMYVNELKTKGVCVIPTNLDVKIAREIIDKDIINFPEFVEDASEYVLGGFSALANPGSFHCASVRKIRKYVHPLLVQIGKIYDGPKRIEQLIDRLMIRPPKAKPSAESWHRDESVGYRPGDLIFGGWINLDDRPQYFSCVLGTHNVDIQNRGFASIPKEQHAEMKAKSTMVEIPPGHLLLFHQHIVHEVLAKAAPYKMYRLFIGLRLTDHKKPLIEDIKKRLKNEDIIPLKSGQLPPMWAKLHWTNHLEKKLVPFSRNVKKEFLHEQTVKSGQLAGKTYEIPYRFMPSLKEVLGKRVYKKYHKDERNMYKPTKLSHYK